MVAALKDLELDPGIGSACASTAPDSNVDSLGSDSNADSSGSDCNADSLRSDHSAESLGSNCDADSLRSDHSTESPGSNCDADSPGSEPKEISWVQDHSTDNHHGISKFQSTVSFLDATDEVIENGQTESVLNTVKRLTTDVKKYKSFLLLFHLNALERFIKLWAKYQHNPKINGPKIKASHAITVSVGKGKYFA